MLKIILFYTFYLDNTNIWIQLTHAFRGRINVVFKQLWFIVDTLYRFFRLLVYTSVTLIYAEHSKSFYSPLAS